MKLWLFVKNGSHDVYDTPLTAVVRSSSPYSAARVFEKGHDGFSADDYTITPLKLNGASGVICTDTREG